MSAATSTILGGLAIAGSIGGSVVGAKIASNTAKKASQIQVDASNRAMDYQQQSQQRSMDWINQQQNRPLQPLGGAAGYLSGRLGIPQQPSYGGLMGGQPPGNAMQPPKIGPAAPGGGGGYRALLSQPSTPSAPPSPGGAPGGAPGGMPNAPGGAPGGGMVTLEAPTGERQSFPPGPQVDAMIRAGARRIG